MDSSCRSPSLADQHGSHDDLLAKVEVLGVRVPGESEVGQHVYPLLHRFVVGVVESEAWNVASQEGVGSGDTLVKPCTFVKPVRM